MDAADFAAGFGAASAEDKEENFERSTLKLVLKQLGGTVGRISRWERGTPFDWYWFNHEDFLGVWLGSAKLNRVPMHKLLTSPSKSEVFEPWKKLLEEAVESGAEAAALIYDTSHYGRMVCTNVMLPNTSHLHVVVRDIKMNITPFRGYFANRYGQTVGDD